MTVIATSHFQEVFTDLKPGGQKVLYGVKWEDYVEFLEETLDQTEVEITYNRGVLKASMGTGFKHENLSRFLHNLITFVALQLKIKVIPTGSMSLVSEKVRKGADPDESYYIQNADRAGFKSKLFDDETDIMPDLVVEIDESHKSDEKFEIYAAFGIKEFWLYDQQILRIFLLSKTGEYLVSENSLALPILSAEVLTNFLNRSQKEDQFELLQEFQNWLQEQNKTEN